MSQGKSKMPLAKLAIAVAISVIVTHVHAAGLKRVKVPADGARPEIDVAVWSPCAAPPVEIKTRPFVLHAVRDCAVPGKNLPLIVVSHGFGGNYLGHHDTAEALADAGFIVAALNHPDDTTSNEARKSDFRALVSRPHDIKRLIDYMIGHSPDSANID